jgi:hypothetical protein
MGPNQLCIEDGVLPLLLPMFSFPLLVALPGWGRWEVDCGLRACRGRRRNKSAGSGCKTKESVNVS